MDEIRLIVEQEISNLRHYESEYQKALKAIDEDTDDAEQMAALYALDSKITAIKSWLAILSVEEYLFVVECVAGKVPLSYVKRTFKQLYRSSPEFDDDAICLLKDKGMEKIAVYLFDEFGDARGVMQSLK
jgi:hypothetical protein